MSHYTDHHSDLIEYSSLRSSVLDTTTRHCWLFNVLWMINEVIFILSLHLDEEAGKGVGSRYRARTRVANPCSISERKIRIRCWNRLTSLTKCIFRPWKGHSGHAKKQRIFQEGIGPTSWEAALFSLFTRDSCTSNQLRLKSILSFLIEVSPSILIYFVNIIKYIYILLYTIYQKVKWNIHFLIPLFIP